MNIVVSASSSHTNQSSGKIVFIAPKQCLDLLNVVKNEVIQSIAVHSLEGLDQNDIRQILIQSNRVLQNGSKIEIHSGDSLDQEKLVSMSKVSGFGSLIQRGDQNQIVLQKKSFKPKKLKLAAKKEEDKNPWSKIQDANVDQNMSINQDDLLKNQADLAEFKKFAKENDCMTKAKPCENCTCGRAELQNGKKKLETGQVQSNCGKCYLGDAFRCASCPYRGLPAFQPGDQVKLNMGGEQQDVPAERVEATTKSSKNGKVMLNFD